MSSKKLDRMFQKEHREVGYELQKMKVENGKDDSLIESILVILRNCRSFREFVSNQIYFDFLKDHFKNQKSLQPIVAFFNFIYSSYTKDDEATAQEFGKILESIRKEHKEYSDPKKTNDIELALLAISSSFRYLIYSMENHNSSKKKFEELLLEVLKLDSETVCAASSLCTVVNALYLDFLEEKPQSMDVEGIDGKMEVLKANSKVVTKMISKPDSITTTYLEMNIFLTQRNYDDEESKFFNELVNAFAVRLVELYGEKKYLNDQLFKPISINFLKDECKLNRYDLQNQVNFGFINMNFKYLSHTKTVSCILTGHVSKTINPSKSEGLESVLNSRITYTQKLTIEHKGLPQHTNLFRLPKIKKFLQRITEIDPNMDIINDYDVMAYVQAKDAATSCNYFRFVDIEERIDKVMHGDIATIFNIIFLNDRRLCNRNAMKIFFTSRLNKGNMMTDPNTSVYVSEDNEEHVIHFLNYLKDNFGLGKNCKEKGEKKTKKLLEKLVFYLPSTLETAESIAQWRKWSGEVRLWKDSTLQDVYDKLVSISKVNLFNEHDKERHIFMCCSIDIDAEDDFKTTSKADEKNSFENLDKDKKNSECVVLNTSLTDILDYVIKNAKIAISGDMIASTGKKKEKTPSFDNNSLWHYFDRYPASFFLPSYLVINVFDVRKLLELGDDLDFDYIESKLNKSFEPISNRYSLMALICQKKDTNPIVYYPCVRQQSTKRLDSKLMKGFIGGQEKEAAVHKVNKELVHFLIFERDVIQFK